MIQEIGSYHSPNYNDRPLAVINCVVIHDTEGAVPGAINWLCNTEAMASAHVVIDKKGAIYRLVDDRYRAWHAGLSVLWPGQTDVNDWSLGVELERIQNDPEASYPKAQTDALIEWIAEKVVQYSIPLNRIVGHRDIAPGRRTDPVGFDWFGFFVDLSRKITEMQNGNSH